MEKWKFRKRVRGSYLLELVKEEGHGVYTGALPEASLAGAVTKPRPLETPTTLHLLRSREGFTLSLEWAGWAYFEPGPV